MNRPHEEWLKQQWKTAEERVQEAVGKFDQVQADAAKDRTQYFEKLTIGCGAAIAAFVSFLGATSDKHPLHPKWMLPSTVALLTFAMFAALYRNFRYQNYLTDVFKKAYLQSELQEQRCKNDLYQAAHTYDWQAAKQINIDEWNPEFQTKDADLKKAIHKLEKEEKRRLTEIAIAGNTCLVSIGIAMVALVVMAFLNFMN
jgi:hypothetical protein